MAGERRMKMKKVLFNKIKIEDLEIGDHIYTWRHGYLYAHHGIYIGDGKVIHFTPAAGQEEGTRTFNDRVSFSSSLISQCPSCGGDHPRSNAGVQQRCLERFLSGGKLYRFRYGVSKRLFYAQVRGTCTRAHTDSPEEVLHRAETLLNSGFGNYHLFKNNCEDFAIYCKTGYNLYFKTTSGQAASLNAAATASVCPISILAVVSIVETSAMMMGGAAIIGGGIAYCVSRHRSDITLRKGIKKIPVEKLVN